MFDVIDFYSVNDRPIALALGFFDCIHKGHEALVHSAINFSKEHSINSAILTFSNDPNLFFKKERQIYTIDDRISILERIGMDFVITANFDNSFASLSPDEFLTALSSNFNVKAIFIGADYTFGAEAKGDVKYLAGFCKTNGIELFVLPYEMVCGEKLSTRNLKSLVKSGEVEVLNTYLSSPYFMKGTVLHERHAGTNIGFPTANIKPNENRLPLANGIYATYCIIDGKKYMSMTNVGIKPTFADNSISIESYILDFSQDVYGKEIKVEFIKKMRDIIRFESASQLKLQLSKDEQNAREILTRYAN